MEDPIKKDRIKKESGPNKKKKGDKIPKDVLNIMRTTMRNGIELTHIADNKANVLLSLNALMLTFLVPFFIPYADAIRHYYLVLPLSILIVTCFVTIYISVLVLKPGKFFENLENIENGGTGSPFFFGNFYKMTKGEYRNYVQKEMAEGASIKDHLTDDLHYIGSRLGRKMELIRVAFNIFMIGFFTALILSLGLFLMIPGA